MRFWLLTNTTYGTWLPGNPRGSVTSVRDRRPGEEESATRVEHDIPGEPWEPEIPGLHRSALELMKGPPIYLDLAHAETLFTQLQETATYRGRTLYAVAIMANHFHLVVEVQENPDPEKILGDFKSYGSRALNGKYGRPDSATWWTRKGSKRRLRDEQAMNAAIHYVLYKQPNPLLVWSPTTGRIV